VRTLPRLLVVVVALLGFSACSAGYGVDRGDYVAANEAILAKLPVFPGSTPTEEISTPYRRTESGPIVGYGTRRVFQLPPAASAEDVTTFYTDRLGSEWALVERLDDPVLNFRRGKAAVSINVDNWRVHQFEVAVDHASPG
jgi:hypothetical protein